MAYGGGWLGVGVTYICTMLGHLKWSTFMFHRVVLPKHGVEFNQQFNGDVIYSLVMIYDIARLS